MRRGVILAVVTGAAVAMLAPATSSAQLPLERGDTGPAVEHWQTDLNFWFRNVTPENRGRMEVDGVFGEVTEESTREFQQGQGLPVTGVVDQRTRSTLDGVNSRLINTPFTQRALEWPLVVPQWFWPWARWHLGRGEFEGRQRDPAVRPAAAPFPIPSWAWRRLNVILGRDAETRARIFAVHRMVELFGPRGISVTTTLRSDRDPFWTLVVGSSQDAVPGSWAMWHRLRGPRWTGWQISRLAETEPTLRPNSVPCDIRPAFAEPEC